MKALSSFKGDVECARTGHIYKNSCRLYNCMHLKLYFVHIL